MNKIILGGVALALVLSVIAFSKAQPGTPGRDGKDGLGAVVSLTSPQEWNGVTYINERYPFRKATSTVITHRVTATSTLQVNCRAIGGLSFAQQYEIAVGTNTTATSTASLGKMYALANGGASVQASTTARVFVPGEFINVKMATTSGTVVSTLLAPTGLCTVTGTTF